MIQAPGYSCETLMIQKIDLNVKWRIESETKIFFDILFDNGMFYSSHTESTFMMDSFSNTDKLILWLLPCDEYLNPYLHGFGMYNAYEQHFLSKQICHLTKNSKFCSQDKDNRNQTDVFEVKFFK